MKGIIFDLDGTLLDTIRDLAEAVNFALGKNGYERLKVSEVQKNVGNGARLLISKSLPEGVDEARYEAVFEDFSKYYREHLAVFTKPYEGVKELLSALKDRGVITAVLSNKPHRATKPLIAHYFGGLVDHCSGEREGIPRKPDPAGVKALLEKMNLKAEDCFYVGDSDVDIKTAENSGMRCISCLWGFRSEEFLKNAGGKIFVRQPKEILEYI